MLEMYSPPEPILAVLEGANHDSACRIAYETLSEKIFNVPDNVGVLKIGEHIRLVLYGKSPDFTYPDGFIRSQFTQETKGGWPLNSTLMMTFEMPRSITTRDGRFYLRDSYFDSKDHSLGDYQSIIETVLKDSKDIFECRRTANELTSMNKRLF